jgi:hypothetical protein
VEPAVSWASPEVVSTNNNKICLPGLFICSSRLGLGR